MGSVVVIHRPSSSWSSGMFPEKRFNPCLLHWQVGASPVDSREVHTYIFCIYFHIYIWKIESLGIFTSKLICSVSKSCLTACNPMDYSMPCSSVLCFLQIKAGKCTHWKGADLPLPPTLSGKKATGRWPSLCLSPLWLHNITEKTPSEQGDWNRWLLHSYCSLCAEKLWFCMLHAG